MSQELGFNRAATSVASSIGRLEGGIEAPLTGWITDRWGARWVILLGVFLISLSLILMRYINSIWGYYLIWGGMLSTGCNVALSLPLDTTISNWFVKKRGLAMSIKWVFSGLSGVLVMPLIAYLVSTQGWRETCFIGGIVMAVIGLPIAWFLIKPHRPEYYGLLPDGAKMAEEVQASQEKMLEHGAKYAAEVQEVEFTLRQAIKTRAFWLLFLAQSIPALVGPVMSIHCIPFLTDKGIDPVRAAAIMAMMIFFSLPTRFLGGVIADRISINHTRYIKVVSYFLQGFSVLLYLINPTITMVYVWFILFGLGQGLAVTVSPFMRARFFGRKAFGTIQGVASMLMTPIGVLAPVYAGWIYDTTGSYEFAFKLFAVLLGAAAVISFFILPPKPPEKLTDARSIV
ncbi:MAG: MFS transporter [Dehalococcoidales bacterium]|nr:MFS transporter [Dehalococcoidales bacterium]